MVAKETYSPINLLLHVYMYTYRERESGQLLYWTVAPKFSWLSFEEASILPYPHNPGNGKIILMIFRAISYFTSLPARIE